ncbi:MAG: hypothetical protein HYY23_11290 [Verrucomicrobia bacterium]|nr:hypothetical protein [Verrucomicrobiota bacterium]
MNRDSLGKHLGVGLAIALVLYLVAYQWIEHRRHVNGPWHVHFQTDASGQPSLSVSHQKLSLSNITFVFSDQRLTQTNVAATIVFETPITNVPFGKVVFLDTTFLPGTVTFELFGHEIELLPRTLVVNLREIPWRSDATFRLTEKDKPKRP